MQTVYISGKVTGLPFVAAKRKFDDAERKLKSMGYKPINPIKIGEIAGFKWEDYMKRDIQMLCDCSYIYPLDNWKDSKGAKLEMEIAKQLRIPILEISLCE